jgi:uncharacterized protein (DUF2062 family)
MLRPFIRSLATRVHRVRDRWYARPFAQWLGDARLWSLQRRGITVAFGAGLAICFVPLPVHVPVALAFAVLARVNVPVILSTVFLVNPLTIVPVYYLAYRVGCLALGAPQDTFSFALSWDWLQHGLGPMWQPFLAGCAICALGAGVLGWFLLELLWRRQVIKKYRARRGGSSG